METNEPRQTDLNPNEQPPEELDDLQKKVRAYPDTQWVMIQRIGGAILGLLCGYLLTFFSAFESVGFYGTIGAVLIALLVPNMVEKRIKRTVQKGRFMLMIALGVWLAGYMIYMLATGVPLLNKTV